MQLQETIRDVKTLHNENLVAVAQKKYVYIYDNQGAEVTTSVIIHAYVKWPVSMSGVST